MTGTRGRRSRGGAAEGVGVGDDEARHVTLLARVAPGGREAGGRRVDRGQRGEVERDRLAVAEGGRRLAMRGDHDGDGLVVVARRIEGADRGARRGAAGAGLRVDRSRGLGLARAPGCTRRGAAATARRQSKRSNQEARSRCPELPTSRVVHRRSLRPVVRTAQARLAGLRASSRILEGKSTLCRGHTASARSATASSSPRMPWKLTEAEGSVSLQRGARSALFAAERAAVVGRGDERLVTCPSPRRGPPRRMEARTHMRAARSSSSERCRACPEEEV